MITETKINLMYPFNNLNILILILNILIFNHFNVDPDKTRKRKHVL